MEEIEIVAGGGKGTKREGWPTEIPPRALLEVAKVMKHGAEKYGSKNWHGNTVNVELDHALNHIYLFLADEGFDVEELSHAAARCLMALDHVLRNFPMRDDFPIQESNPKEELPSCVPAFGEQL